MRTALDSSVIFAIFKHERTAASVFEIMERCAHDGDLVICETTYAELAPASDHIGVLNARLEELNLRLLPSTKETLFLAGRIFRAYRDAGGPRLQMMPDFMIAAHAQNQTARIIANDRGYYRRYFPKLKVLSPTGADL